MNDSIVLAIITGLGGMLGWGFADFFAKKTIDKIGDVTTLFWGQLIGIAPLLILFLFNSKLPQLHHFDPLAIILLGVFSGLAYIPAYIAFGKGKVSLLSPIFASSAVLVVLLSATFFHEVLTPMQIVAIAVVSIGILLISADPRELYKVLRSKSKHKTDGLAEMLLATVSYSFWLIALDRFISGKDWIPILLGIRIFSTLTLFVYAKLTQRKLLIKGHTMWKYLVGIGCFDVFAFAAVSYGFSATSHTSIVAVLSASFSIPTIILARTFLKEKVTMLQTVASLIIILGIVLVSLT